MSKGEGNGPGLAIWWRLAVRGWVIVRVAAVVWEYGGRECGVWRYTRRQQESRAPEQPAGDQRAHATQGGGVTEDRATKVKGQRSERKGGARSNVGRIQDDTTTPQNHNHNAAPNRRRQGRGRMKN